MELKEVNGASTLHKWLYWTFDTLLFGLLGASSYQLITYFYARATYIFLAWAIIWLLCNLFIFLNIRYYLAKSWGVKGVKFWTL